jgi:MFS family permease
VCVCVCVCVCASTCVFGHRFSNRRVLLVGLLAQTVATLVRGVAFTVPVYYVGTCVSALGMMAFPAIAAIKANNVDQSEQGAVQGALVGIQQLAAVIGPAAIGGLYAVGKAQWGADGGALAYYVGGLLSLVACFLSYALPTGASPSEQGSSQTPRDLEMHIPTSSSSFVVSGSRNTGDCATIVYSSVSPDDGNVDADKVDEHALGDADAGAHAFSRA